MKPSDEATYERARRLANLAIWTVKIQLRRLQSVEPEDEEFIIRKFSDFHFLIVALTRLRRAAELAQKVDPLKKTMKKAIRDFDSSLPSRKKMRDIAEHIDEYAIDSGRNKSVSRKSLEVASCNGTTWTWLGHDLNTNEAMKASDQLFEAKRLSQNLLQMEPNK